LLAIQSSPFDDATGGGGGDALEDVLCEINSDRRSIHGGLLLVL
jgi:hypothetical protein